jgi:hypothetical protein
MNDCETMVTSNIRVPALPRIYLIQTKVHLLFEWKGKRMVAYGMDSLINAVDSGGGSDIFGDDSIDAT